MTELAISIGVPEMLLLLRSVRSSCLLYFLLLFYHRLDSVSDRITDRFLLAAFDLELICVAVAVDMGDGADEALTRLFWIVLPIRRWSSPATNTKVG